MTTVTQKITYKLRNDIAVKINKLPMKYFDKKTNGEVLSVITNDIDTFKKDAKNNFYILEVEDSSVIGSIINYKMDILTEREVRVYIEKEDVPLLLKELILRNVKVYSASEENLSLEDAFLKKTGGNVIE